MARATREANPLERVTSREDLEKLAPAGIFGYPAGKSIIAKRLVGLIPAHKTYVEPFCGSAAIFFAKEASPVEVLNDIDEDVVGALKLVRNLKKSDLEELRQKHWIADRAVFEKLRGSTPASISDQLHKFLYVLQYSYARGRKSFDTSKSGVTSRVTDRVMKFQPRLQNAKLMNGDYERAIKANDGPDSFHFIDPPYVGYSAGGNGVGEKGFDEKRLRKVLEDIKGKFLLTYGVKGNLDTSGFNVKRMRQDRTSRFMSGVKDTSKTLTHLLVSNYDITKKMDGFDLDDVVGVFDQIQDEVRMMPAGSVSISVPREVTTQKSDDPTMRYPSAAATAPALVQVRFHDRDCEVDLIFKCDDADIAWTFGSQSADVVGDAREVAKSFSVAGSRFFQPMTRGVVAKLMPDEVIATDVVKIDRPRVEFGLQTETVHEYFISKGDEVGVLKIERGGDQLGAQYPWIATFVDRWPAILNEFTVLKEGSPMPPEGVSALPENVARAVPLEFRYWEMSGEDALRARDALALSKMLSGENIAIVDDELCVVKRKIELELVTTPDALPTSSWQLTKCAQIVPDGAELVEVFSPDRLSKADSYERVVFCDGGDAIDGTLDILAKALLERDGHYIVSAFDSAGARASLAKLGPVFKFRPGAAGVGVDAVRKLFVASFPVQIGDDVVWLGKAFQSVPDAPHKTPDDGKPKARFYSETDDKPDLGKAAEFNNPSSGTPAPAPDVERQERRKDDLSTGGPGTLQPAQGNPYRHRDRYEDRHAKMISKADDEQVVYGIVLEPDTVDAQNDIYSAEEVRTAAHKYMEQFQNAGLMHEKKINDKAKVIESFVAPCAFTMNGQSVKKGTWCMAMKINDPKIWADAKQGRLTGFSIGGSAQRTPELTSKAMRKTSFQGIPITIDRPKGYVQTGRDPEGAQWSREYKVDYGYIPRTKGGDGEGVDVFLGSNPDAQTAYWIAQKKSDGSFDEWKIILGADSEAEAHKIYTDHVPSRFIGETHSMPIGQMKSLLNKEPEHKMQPGGWP